MSDDALLNIDASLCKAVGQLRFAAPVAYVYNPLDYAWDAHAAYLQRWGKGRKEVLLLGMNPGPFGMAQTGVPFGDVAMVRDFIGITAKVGKPKREHPKRRIEGFDCARSEVSGTRLWGWAEQRFEKPERFFKRFFVANYCPLSFMEASGRNLTPDKLPKSEQTPLFQACDVALAGIIEQLRPKFVIGVGGFAEKRARAALTLLDARVSRAVVVGSVLHPSPASPAANRGWAQAAERDLTTLGIEL